MYVKGYGHLFTACGHIDTLYAAPREEREWTSRSDRGHVDLPRLLETGVNLQVFALFCDPSHRAQGYAVKTLEMIERFYAGFESFALNEDAKNRSAGYLGPVRTREELGRVGEGFGGVLSIEGGEALGGSLEALHAFFRLGVRAMGLVWNHRNDLADGVADRASNGGLTPFGRKVVSEMERLGMVVDVSHLSEPGFWDVARLARRPFIASHSNAKALCDHPRNLTDDQLRAVADSGGTIGVNFCSAFLTSKGKADLSHVVDHVCYIADKAGIDHVALGTDYDGIESPPSGLEDVTRLSKLVDALEARGLAREDVRKVMGENLARVYSEILPAGSADT